MLLGITMMGSSVLMFLLLGTTVLKPSVLRPQREELNCTMVHTHIADDWLDCAFICDAKCHGQGGYPCLRVLVNLTHSGQQALLHYDEEAIHTNPKCFYMPKCRKDKDDLLSSALDIKEFFDHKNGTPFACFSSPSHPGDVVLVSRSDQAMVFHCLFWPSLTLVGGALIVGMVRLTQHLSLLCQQHSTARRAEAGGRGCSVGRRRSTLYGVARNRV